jgi:hypothetical protein
MRCCLVMDVYKKEKIVTYQKAALTTQRLL